jgi:alkylation response protein AidB-like acyl-CoA dehydrogenase
VLAEVDGDVAGRVLPGIADGVVTVAVALRLADLSVAGGSLSGTIPVLCGAGSTTHLLACARDGRWYLVDIATPGVRVEPGGAVDLSRTVGSAELTDVPLDAVDALPLDLGRVRDVAVALAAAESAGVAGWALTTAVEYAGVREQFGRRIGSFQAVKHLCAQMLEAAESATAVAWDAAVAYDDDPEQFGLAASVAGAVALDAAADNAKDCIQVLGGIGFTWEHDAHLYLRRALANRLVLGGTDAWRLRLADAALGGARRRPHVDLDGAADEVRQQVHVDVAGISRLPETEQRVALVEKGLLTPHWPAPYGLDARPAAQIVIDEELEAAGVTRPDLGIGAWAAPTVLRHGDDGQRERFVGPTLRGEILWCQLFSEPGAGSDLASLRTRAVRVDGGWRLTGQKVWTSLANESDWAICLARTDPEAPKHRGITYFLVEMASEGIDVRPLREITGESLFNEVFLDGVFVPDDCVVGDVDDGWKLARTTLANERVAISGSSLGRSVEQALEVASRTGEVAESVRVRLGAAVADAATGKALGLRATLRSISGAGPGPESSVQKLVGVRQRQDSAELALELLGDRALLGDPEASAAVAVALNTRCLSIAGGTTQVLRNVAAERILGLPRD